MHVFVSCVFYLAYGLILMIAAAASSDPASNHRSKLSSAVRGLTASLNGLMDAFSSAAPAQKESDIAVRTIQASLALLKEGNAPVDTTNYFQCSAQVMASSKVRSRERHTFPTILIYYD
jgi:hypothetical protein